MMNFMAFFYLKIALQAQGKPKETNPHNLEQQSKEWLKGYDAGLEILEAYSRFFNAA